MKTKGKKTQISNIKNEIDFNTDATAIEMIIREYTKQPHIHKFLNLEEMDQSHWNITNYQILTNRN